jgi:hypothetical protein
VRCAHGFGGSFGLMATLLGSACAQTLVLTNGDVNRTVQNGSYGAIP